MQYWSKQTLKNPDHVQRQSFPYVERFETVEMLNYGVAIEATSSIKTQSTFSSKNASADPKV